MKAKKAKVEEKPIVKATKDCGDKKCPFHGKVVARGRTFSGSITKKDTNKTATLMFTRMFFIRKYERYEKRRTKLRVHNPACINADIGDYVKISECRPLSKTKKFVIIKKIK